jgi:hypothetical protein
MEVPMKDRIEVREISTAISDSAKIKIGDYTPLFPPPVRGRPTNVNDGGKVRLGAYSPVFPPLRRR